MLSLFQAEWLKTTGNRWMVGLLVWLFPVGITVFFLAGAIVTLLIRPGGGALPEADLRWTIQAIAVWQIPAAFPGTLFILGLAANVFAGESAWNTWKNIVPLNRRVHLILVKYLTVGAIIFVAFNLAALGAALGASLLKLASDQSIEPVPDGAVLGQFLGDYLIAMFVGFVSTLVTTAYAALAALFARSILFGVIGGLMLQLLDQGVVALLFILSQVLDQPRIVILHQLTPSYNLGNAGLLLGGGQGFTGFAEYAGTEPNSLGLSLLILGAWLLGLGLLNLFFFLRRDVR